MSRICRRPAFEEGGYTLLEMMVVLVLIGMIAAIATPQLMKLLGGAKSDAALLQIDSLAQSLEFYQLDNGQYPTVEEGLIVLWNKPDNAGNWRGPYIRKERQLTDPWGNAYLYKVPGTQAPFEIRSLGADGKEGGEGVNADLSSNK